MELDLISPDHDEERLAGMLKALGHPLRLSILKYVRAHSGCICNDIVVRTGRAQSTISQHLHTLQSAGLIESVHDGQATSYYLNRQALDWLRSALDAELL
jgi:ArsR family transcriptional regulator, arsenate/arsenite/antimonite-responsive transcriptional repressor